MTTDEQILALTKLGFTLPPNLDTDGLGNFYFCGAKLETTHHDLCAMHFAQHVRESSWPVGDTLRWKIAEAMSIGDSASAIAALYEAITEKKTQ